MSKRFSYFLEHIYSLVYGTVVSFLFPGVLSNVAAQVAASTKVSFKAERYTFRVNATSAPLSTKLSVELFGMAIFSFFSTNEVILAQY